MSSQKPKKKKNPNWIKIEKHHKGSKENLEVLGELGEDEKFFTKISENADTFQHVCRTVGKNAKRWNIDLQKLNGKFMALKRFNINKNPQLSEQAWLCGEIAKDEINMSSKKLMELREQSSNEEDFRENVRRKIKKIL